MSLSEMQPAYISTPPGFEHHQIRKNGPGTPPGLNSWPPGFEHLATSGPSPSPEDVLDVILGQHGRMSEEAEIQKYMEQYHQGISATKTGRPLNPEAPVFRPDWSPGDLYNVPPYHATTPPEPLTPPPGLEHVTMSRSGVPTSPTQSSVKSSDDIERSLRLRLELQHQLRVNLMLQMQLQLTA
eukprot:gnl/TRDRNA2_/TRDRNA2_178994_c0_seq1.p1 gnl/TRDRNA2_/TRDRNA2_178994_c0~~gnl/TRDRNA2_/TRDRNA2_178994_c0_seq1.p1  ORF type:complete len:183 (+),score=23.29 gnl/TRDRNA2_/TRDRNA2_178994_c0_seq1:223-771(+)